METSTPSPLLLKEKDVKALLQIGRSTYYQLINTGQLRSVRIGRCVYVPHDAVHDLVKNLPTWSKVEDDQQVA